MAKVSFTAAVASIVGKLAGSVFQYSYGGYQLHAKGKPRNPQTPYQQLRRGDFGFLSASWRSLTSVQRQTFIDNAPPGIQAINFFTAVNTNLALISAPQITSYVPTSTPADMPVEPLEVTNESYIIKASGATAIVPAGTALCIFSTYQKQPTKIFTNPSEYSPIATIGAGTDLSTGIDIYSEFIARFGQLTIGQYLCVKSALIDITNGNRTDTVPSCATITDMPKQIVYAAIISQSGTAAPTIVEKINTIGTVTAVRNFAGSYSLQSASLFTTAMLVMTGENKTPGTSARVIFTAYSNPSDIEISTYNGTTLTDGILNQTQIMLIIP